MISTNSMMLWAQSRKKHVATQSNELAYWGRAYTSVKSPALIDIIPSSGASCIIDMSGMPTCSKASLIR